MARPLTVDTLHRPALNVHMVQLSTAVRAWRSSLGILAALAALAGCESSSSSNPSSASGTPTPVADTPVATDDATGIVHGPGAYGGASRPAGKSKQQRMQALMEWIRGAYIDGAPAGPMPEVDAAFTELGDRLYTDLCASCHGDAGDGRGPDALRPPPPAPDSHDPGEESEPKPLDPRPRDFTKAVYKLRSTPSGKLPTDADLFRSISAGLHGSAMIPFVALEERERWALVAKVKRLSPRFDGAKPAEPIEVPDPPKETTELAQKGRTLFVELGCADCHGDAGKGDGKRSADLEDDAGEPISPRDLTMGRFRRGAEMTDLYLTLKTGFDGTPMAAFEAYSDEQLWALAAFVRSLVNDPVHRQDNPPVHPQERLGLRIGMRPLLGAAGP